LSKQKRNGQQRTGQQQTQHGLSVPNDPYARYYEQTADSIKKIAGINRWMMFLTFGLVLASFVQDYWTRQSVKGGQDAFRVTERAQVIFGNDKGELMNIQTIGDESDLLIYLQNKGHISARNVELALNILVAPPDITLEYRNLNPAPEYFNPGFSLGPGQPFTGYIKLSGPAVLKSIKDSTAIMRVVGRLRYIDDFGPYCDPFAVGYKPTAKPPRFEEEFVPPQSAICDPNSPDSETLSSDRNVPSVYHVQFHLLKSEQLSPEQPPQPPK
jgi:hypothetical protein